MASGFIILKDGRCFARRWTGYDEIIRIVICELENLEAGKEFSEWLKLQIPNSPANENEEAGWGFYNSKIDDWVTRELDLRSLTKENQQLFWKAIQLGKINLKNKGNSYTSIRSDFFEDFYKMCYLSEIGEPPSEFTDSPIINEPCIEQNGPGWKIGKGN